MTVMNKKEKPLASGFFYARLLVPDFTRRLLHALSAQQHLVSGYGLVNSTQGWLLSRRIGE